MEKLMRWILPLLFIVLIIDSIPSANAETNDDDYLLMRSGPGVSYEVIENILPNEEFEIIESIENWHRVQFNQQMGWIPAWQTNDEHIQSDEKSKIISKVDYLNIRLSPSVDSSILGRMNAGDTAQLIEQEGDWSQILFDGSSGWVHKDYITIQSDYTPEMVEKNSIGKSFTVAVDATHIRKKPNLNAKKIGTITKDETFTVLKTDGNWVQIAIDKRKTGWVYSFYGTLNTSEPITDEQPISNQRVTILSNGTNIREDASTQSTILLRANAGDQFEVSQEFENWYEISLPSNEKAYVAKWVVGTNTMDTVFHNKEQVQKARVPGTLQGLTIVIDPGHGGTDYGTVGFNGTSEKLINLQTSVLLASKLRAAGANVIMTRETDTYISLRKRVSIAHQHNTDAFISIHYDANEDSTITGFTTYYTHTKQKNLAMAVNNGLSKTVSIRDRGAQPGNYLVLRENRQNAILIELGFLSNQTEERTITTDMFREMATQGIYQGLLDYFDAN